MTSPRALVSGGISAGLVNGAQGDGLDPKGHNLPVFDVTALQRQMQQGRLTAVALTQACLTRIELIDRSGPRLRAVIELNPDATEIAQERDHERRAGQIRGPLHGIPVLIKDNIATADLMQTTAGSLALI
jgi:amidase